jgi:cell division protein FtsW (lipid II flippase)
MPIIWIVLIILLIGVLVTLIITQVPDAYLAPAFKKLILWAAIIGIIVWLVFMFAPADFWNMRVHSNR